MIWNGEIDSGYAKSNSFCLGEREYTPDEEIDRKQAELVAAQIALEKLRQHDRLLTTKNDMLVEENNLLKAQNEELCSKLLRSEGILSRIKEELTRFRAANGRAANGINPCIHGGAGGGQCSTSFLLNSLSEFFVVASPLQLVGRQVYVEERRPSSNSNSTMSCGGGRRGRGRGSYQNDVRGRWPWFILT
ncbi:hypothetical protein POM88_011082 [Heracleum sosnowskyi]|uniref:Uncharacterized protein n=1 Tax=Heracleum sosnowskyi TaxID=360622 RepID=A0AAD8N0X6_9APIA|nr:hypothetical protein POM88_011082 [Heracleum sosnowskyi]